MPSIDFDSVRSRISMGQVLDWLGFQPTRRTGDQWRGGCPIHDCPTQRRRSFSANLAKNRYRCFHCGSFGNQIELWAEVHKVSIYQAALELCLRAQIPVPRKNPPPTERRNR
jgi:DNA primase